MRKNETLTTSYGSSSYSAVSGVTEQLSQWIEERGWSEPLVIWDTPEQVLPVKTVRSSLSHKALTGATCDVLIIIGDEVTTDRVKESLVHLYERPRRIPFEVVVIPTTYSSTRSLTGRFLESDDSYHYDSRLIPSLMVIDEKLLRNRPPLVVAVDVASLLTTIYDMFTRVREDSFAWQLLLEAHSLYTCHAASAVHTRSSEDSRELTALCSHLVASAQNSYPPGLLDACVRAVTSLSDLPREQSSVLVFPQMVKNLNHALPAHRAAQTTEIVDQMLDMYDKVLASHTQDIPKTLHAISRAPYTHTNLTLTDLARIAEMTYTSVETALTLPDIDLQSIIHWVESIYWGYEVT